MDYKGLTYFASPTFAQDPRDPHGDNNAFVLEGDFDDDEDGNPLNLEISGLLLHLESILLLSLLSNKAFEAKIDVLGSRLTVVGDDDCLLSYKKSQSQSIDAKVCEFQQLF